MDSTHSTTDRNLRAARCQECETAFVTDHDWLAQVQGTAHSPGCSLQLANLAEDLGAQLAAARAARQDEPLAPALRKAALRALSIVAPAAGRRELATWLDTGRLPDAARTNNALGRVTLGYLAPSAANVLHAAALLAGVLADEQPGMHPAGHAFDVDRLGLRVLREDDAIITLACGDLTRLRIEDGPGHWPAPSGLPADCADPLRVARRLRDAAIPARR